MVQVRLVTALMCAGTVVGVFGRRAWLVELASHFVLQYAWALTIEIGRAHV